MESCVASRRSIRSGELDPGRKTDTFQANRKIFIAVSMLEADTAASLLINDGVELKMVSDLLGHNSINITADIYGHVFDHSRQELADRMEAILTAKASK